MKSKYQKYYNALTGKQFNSFVSRYSSTLNSIRTGIANMESLMISSWDEKGLEYMKSDILPSLKSQETNTEQGVSALSTAVSKCSTLVGKLEELNDVCNSYDNCEEEQKSTYLHRMNALESEIDGLISEINSISLEVSEGTGDASTASAYSNLDSISRKKQEFLGNVNDSSKFYVDESFANKAKELECFDNTTGEIIRDGDSIVLKPNETRVLTVRLPYNGGQIEEIVRTTADGNADYRSGNIVTAKSDVNKDPNVVDYVNYKNNKWPENVDLHTNYYDWIITANSEGEVVVSQTCEYRNTEGETPKAMIQLNVRVENA